MHYMTMLSFQWTLNKGNDLKYGECEALNSEWNNSRYWNKLRADQPESSSAEKALGVDKKLTISQQRTYLAKNIYSMKSRNIYIFFKQKSVQSQVQGG